MLMKFTPGVTKSIQFISATSQDLKLSTLKINTTTSDWMKVIFYRLKIRLVDLLHLDKGMGIAK